MLNEDTSIYPSLIIIPEIKKRPHHLFNWKIIADGAVYILFFSLKSVEILTDLFIDLVRRPDLKYDQLKCKFCIEFCMVLV